MEDRNPFGDFMASVLEAQAANRKSELALALSILASGAIIYSHTSATYFNWVTNDPIEDIESVPLGSMHVDRLFEATNTHRAVRPEWLTDSFADAMETFVWESAGNYEDGIADMVGWKLENVEWAVRSLTPEDLR